MRKAAGDETTNPDLPPHLVAVEIEKTLVMALRPEAARRQLSVPSLINQILSVTVEDHLTGAILDD